jgi:hypothetical protein
LTDFLGLPPTLLLLLPFSLAAGVDLFLTLLVVAVSFDPIWVSPEVPLPPPLRWGIPSLLGLFYLLEGGLELRPLPCLIWHNLQLVLRPVAAFLLSLTLIEGAPLSILIPAALGAAVVAAFAHVLSWGGKVQRLLSPPTRVSPLTFTLAEDTLALALLVAAIEAPVPAFLLSGALLLGGLVLGAGRHHLVRFGVPLLVDRFWGIFSPTSWAGADELPPWVRELAKEHGILGLRGLRAGALGLPLVRGFREGWLLEAGPRAFLALRRVGEGTLSPLDEFEPFPPEVGAVALRIPMRAQNGAEWALFLQRGAPVQKSHKWQKNL